MSDLKKINHRLVTCFQSSGRIGKSTVFEGILAWARFAGIPVAAVDCDAEHLTLSKRFPEAAFVDATRSNDEFLQLIMDMRRKRQSWQEIVNHLETLGITSDKGSICAFFKRHRRRPAPMGMEPEIETPKARRFVPQAPSLDLPELTESLPPEREFGPDPLTRSIKKKWNILTPTQN